MISQSVINLTNNLVYHDIIKHVDVRFHFIRILLKNGILSLEKIYTSQSRVDMLIKVVMMEKMKTCSASWIFKAEDPELSHIKFTMS